MADHVQRFIFEEADIRGELIQLEAAYQRIMEQHQYPPHVQKKLGEILACAVLLTSSIKFEGDLTIQFQGQGVIEMMVAKCSHNLEVRGLAKWDESADALAFDNAFGEGRLVITIQFADNPQYYQSIVPLEHKTIAESLELYFRQSEQLTTKLWLASSEHQVAGMLLQLLPELSAESEVVWVRAVAAASALDPRSLLQGDSIGILDQLYPEDDLRIFAERSVTFRCTCNTEKMEQAVLLLGERDAQALLEERQAIVVRCEYCNYAYTFDPIDVAHIFSKHKGQSIH